MITRPVHTPIQAYPPRDNRPIPPPERGERIATFPRGRDGEQELRVSIDSYEGHEYVAIRLWERSRDGDWWPTKKGCSIRLRELDDLVRVLAAVADRGDDEPSRQAPPSDDRAAAPQRRPIPGASASTARASAKVPDNAEGFSEF